MRFRSVRHQHYAVCVVSAGTKRKAGAWRHKNPPRSFPHGCVFSQKGKRYLLVKEKGWYVVYRNDVRVTALRSFELGRDFVMGANSVKSPAEELAEAVRWTGGDC